MSIYYRSEYFQANKKAQDLDIPAGSLIAARYKKNNTIPDVFVYKPYALDKTELLNINDCRKFLSAKWKFGSLSEDAFVQMRRDPKQNAQPQSPRRGYEHRVAEAHKRNTPQSSLHRHLPQIKANDRDVEKVEEASMFCLNIGGKEKRLLKLGDVVMFHGIKAVIRWIGKSGKIAVQLLEDDTLGLMGKVTFLPGYPEACPLGTPAAITWRNVPDTQYFILAFEEPRVFPTNKLGSLFAYDAATLTVVDLESSKIYSTSACAYFSYLIEITAHDVMFLLGIERLHHRLETIASGQLSLVSGEVSTALVIVVKGDQDPRTIDYSASGTITELSDGLVKVQINGKDEWTTIDNVFDIGNPPTWVTDGQKNLKDHHYEDGDLVKVGTSRTDFIFGIIKAIVEIKQLDSISYAVMECLKEFADTHRPPVPRIIIPYLRSFITDTARALVVPLPSVKKVQCFMVNEDIQLTSPKVLTLERGKLLIELAYQEYVDVEKGSKIGLSSFSDRSKLAPVSAQEFLFLCRIEKAVNRCNAKQIGLLNNIIGSTADGIFLHIGDGIHPSDIDYNDVIMNLSFGDGYVLFTKDDKREKTTIDCIYEVAHPPEWISQAKKNLTESYYEDGEIVAIVNSDPPQFGIVRSIIRLLPGEGFRFICLDLFMEDFGNYSQRIPKPFLAYLNELVSRPELSAILRVEEVCKTQLYLLLEDFDYNNNNFSRGSIYGKYGADYYSDIETGLISQGMNLLLRKAVQISSSQLPYLLKVRKDRRIMVHFCEQLNLLNIHPPINNVYLYNSDSATKNLRMGNIISFNQGTVTVEVNGKQHETTIDKCYALSHQPSWLTLRTTLHSYCKFSLKYLVKIRGANSSNYGIVKDVLRLPWMNEDVYLVEPVTVDNDPSSQVSDTYNPIIPYLKCLKYSEEVTVVSESMLSTDENLLYFITVKTEEYSVEKGTLWKVGNGLVHCAEGRHSSSSFDGDMGRVVEISASLFSTLSQIRDKRERFNSFSSTKQDDVEDTKEEEHFQRRDSHKLSYADKGDKDFSDDEMDVAKETSFETNDPVSVKHRLKRNGSRLQRATSLSPSSVEHKSRKCFIVITENEDMPSSLGTLWYAVNEKLVCSDDPNISWTPTTEEIIEITWDQFASLKDIRDRMKRINKLFRIQKDTGSAPMDISEKPTMEGSIVSNSQDLKQKEPYRNDRQHGGTTENDGRTKHTRSQESSGDRHHERELSDQQRYFISITETEDSASLGTLWRQDENQQLHCCDSDKPQGTVPAEIKELNHDEFQRLIQIKNKDERLAQFINSNESIHQPVVRKTEEEQNRDITAAGRQKSPSETKRSGRREESGAGNGSDSTPRSQVSLPTWICSREENWEKFKIGRETIVEIVHSKAFAVIKSILDVLPLKGVYVVLDPIIGDFTDFMDRKTPEIIERFLPELVVDLSEVFVIPKDEIKVPSYEFYLTTDELEDVSNSHIPRGSIVFSSSEDKLVDVDAWVEFRKPLSKTSPLKRIPSLRLPFLLRISDKQSRMEVFFSDKLDMVNTQKPIDGVLVIEDKQTPTDVDYEALGKIIGFDSGYVRVQLNENVMRVTIDKIFDFMNHPKWLSDFNEVLQDSGFEKDQQVEIISSSAVGKLKAVVNLPWENEYMAILNLLKKNGKAKFRQMPRSVIAFLPTLEVDVHKVAMISVSQIRAVAYKQFFLKVDDDFKGSLWTLEDGQMQCHDSDQAFPAAHRSEYGKFTKIDGQVFRRLADERDLTRRYHHHVVPKELKEKQKDPTRRKSSPTDKNKISQLSAPPVATEDRHRYNAKKYTEVPDSEKQAYEIRCTFEYSERYPIDSDVTFVDEKEKKKLEGKIRWTGTLSCVFNSLMAVVELKQDNHQEATNGTFFGQRLAECKPQTAILLCVKKLMTTSSFMIGDFVEVILQPEQQGYVRQVDRGNIGIELIKKDLNPLKARSFCPLGFGLIANDFELRTAVVSKELEDVKEDVQPLSERHLSSVEGRNKGIQGESNSCYMDSLLFSLFAFDETIEKKIVRKKQFKDSQWIEMAQRIILHGIVYPLRKNKYVRFEKVSKLRQLLVDSTGSSAYLSETRDLPEFIGDLFQNILKMDDLVSMRYGNNSTGTFCVETIPLTTEIPGVITSQLYLEFASISMNFSICEMPEILLLQLPREKMHESDIVVPSLILDLRYILSDDDTKSCAKCNIAPATHSSQQLFDQRGISSTFLCKGCADFHKDKVALPPPARGMVTSVPYRNTKMRLSAVICIERSHYNCFVRCGDEPNSSWVFFDSMADRTKEGENIPEIKKVDVPKWIRKVLNTPTFDKGLISDEGEIKSRLFKYPYALVYHPSK